MFGGRAARAHTRTHARAQPISLPFLPPDSRFPMTDLHYLVPNRGFEEGSLQSLAYMAVARARGCNAIGWNNVPYKEGYLPWRLALLVRILCLPHIFLAG